MKLEGKVALITGGGRGIGAAIAKRFVDDGAKIVISDIRDDLLQGVKKSLKAGMVETCAGDVTNFDDVKKMVAATVKFGGKIDVLVNNAGIDPGGSILDIDIALWKKILDVNLNGPFLCMRAASRSMTGQGSGHIISVASIAGVRGRDGQANYASSKAGLIGLTKAAAKEFGGANIQVNCVLPGLLPTDMGAAARERVHGQVIAETTLGRTSNAVEVAAFILHLSRMQNVSGQVFNLDSRIL